MLFFFFCIGSILSLSKEKLKRALNVTVGLCVVYPDSSIFDFSKNNNFQALMNMIKGRFSLSTYPYSQYSLSDKSSLSKHSSNFIITRDKKFLEHYIGNLSVFSIAEEINQAFYSYVEILNESTLQQFKEDTCSLFLLTGPSIIKEYEDAAFFYRNTNARFGFLYQNTTNENNNSDSFESLYFIKNKYNVSRIYDMSVPMIQFIRSCKIEKKPKSSFQKTQMPSKYKNHSFQFVAITDNFTEEIQSAFDYINKSSYGSAIDFDVVPWENATELKKMCQIKKPESNLTYVFYPKLRERQYVDCNVFQDMDFYSKELLFFFVSKSLKGWSIDRKYKSNSGFPNIFSINSSPITLTQSTFSNFVPGKNLALVFIDCPNSFSLFEARTIFNSLFHEFNEIKIMRDDNNRHLRPVDFYMIEYYIDSFKLPSADSFPTFAIFEPYNKLANVFTDFLTIENLRNWILKFASEEEEEEEPIITEEKQRYSFFNDFNTFIKDLSMGNSGKQINKNDIDQNSPKPAQNSPKPSPVTNENTVNQNSNPPETTQKSPVQNENEKIEILGDSNSPLQRLFSSFGLNFNFDEIKEIKILSDIEEDNLDENTNDNNMNNEEIEKLVEKTVKNIFIQEKEQMKKEIIEEVLDTIQNKQNLTKRYKITEKNLDKNESTEKVSKKEVKSEVKTDSYTNISKDENKNETTKITNSNDLKQEIKNNVDPESKEKTLKNEVKKDNTENVPKKDEEATNNQKNVPNKEAKATNNQKNEPNKDEEATNNQKNEPNKDEEATNNQKNVPKKEEKATNNQKNESNKDEEATDNQETGPEQEKTISRRKSSNDEHIFELDEESEDEL